MALIICSACGRASIDVDRKCQFCGKLLKIGIWARKLRRKEGYGLLLIATGSFLLPLMKVVGIAMLLLGSYYLLKPRVPYDKQNKVLKNTIRFTDNNEAAERLLHSLPPVPKISLRR